MIIVSGWVKLGEGELERLKPAALKMMEETRKEEGCIEYVYSATLEDPDVMRISERWENAEALAAHGQAPHMAEFNKAIGGANIQGISIKRYDASNEATIMGE